MFTSGEIHRLYRQWFQSPIPPNGVNLGLPMHPVMRRVIEQPTDSLVFLQYAPVIPEFNNMTHNKATGVIFDMLGGAVDSRQDTKDIRGDRRDLSADRRELAADRKAGDKDAVKGDLKDIRADRKDLNADVKDRRADAKDLRKDRRDRRQDRRDLRQDRRDLKADQAAK